MSFWMLLQIIIDLIVVAGLAGIWIKRSRPAKDDPRLSRGLQLLQTKIAVLEDLGDRTELQVTQLTALMESKAKEIQNHILNADKQVQRIENSMGKSMEVARIFQDKIPHREIIERQNTVKYVQAARLAHQGVGAEEISKQVDLSLGEIEFISKVNRDNLQFSEEDLPEWALEEAAQTAPAPQAAAAMPTMTAQTLPKAQDQVSLSDLGERFRTAIAGSKEFAASATPPQVINPAAPVAARAPEPEMQTGRNSRGETIQIKKVVFPKVSATNRAF